MSILLCALTAFGPDIIPTITDIIGSEEVASAVTVVQAFQDADREITETDEYYLGRSVAAYVLTNYTPDWHSGRNLYLNLLGTALAGYSPRPFTYGGYRFLLLDSPEVNAMACPGGLIFITRGLSDLALNEDEMAAILAHEIAHVALSHGTGAVSRAKMTAAWTTLGTEGARHLGGSEVRELARNYGDIVSEITETIVTTGYGRNAERSADSLAVRILAEAGYSPGALAQVLDRMARQGGTQGFWKTHPAPSDRAAWVRSIVQACGYPEPDAAALARRTQRFTAEYTNASGSPEAGRQPAEQRPRGDRGSASGGGASGRR